MKLAALILLSALPAHAATLRPVTRLDGPVVRVSDLFDDVGAPGSRPLGLAPPVGERLVLHAAQLAAIARQFGVDWQPASTADQIVLERPGAALPEASVTGPLRTALRAAGAADGDLDMPGFATPLLPADARPVAVIEQVSLQSDTQRFTAGVAVSGAGMDTLHLRLSGRIVTTIEVPVATRTLRPGAPIGPDDVVWRRVRAATVPADAARTLEALLGLTPRRPLAEGAPVPLSALGRLIAVARGDRVAITLSAPGLLVAGGGEALEAGGLGETVAVLNPASRAVLRAVVIGPDAVRVEPGSTPQVAAR